MQKYIRILIASLFAFSWHWVFNNLGVSSIIRIISPMQMNDMSTDMYSTIIFTCDCVSVIIAAIIFVAVYKIINERK